MVSTPVQGLEFPVGIAVDKQGNLYVNDMPTHAVYKETLSNGAYTQSTVTTNTVAPQGLAVDESGNVYIADEGNNCVYKMIPANDGSYTQTLVIADLTSPTTIALDGHDNIYVGDNLGNVWSLVPGSDGYTKTNVASGHGQIEALAADASGNVYLSDIQAQAIFVEKPGIGESEILSTGTYNWGLAVDNVGNLYITSTNGTVTEASPNGGGYVIILLNNGAIDPRGIAIDANQNLYFAEAPEFFGPMNIPPSNGGDVKKQALGSFDYGALPLTSSVVKSVPFVFIGEESVASVKVTTGGADGLDFTDAGTGNCVSTTDSPFFEWSQTCVVNVNFTPKFPGRRSGAVSLLDADGNILASANLQGVGQSSQIAFLPATTSSLGGNALQEPYSSALDGAGNLYVVDQGLNGLLRIAPDGTTTQVNLGEFAPLNHPMAAAVDGVGNVFIADTNNSRVLKVSASGQVSRVGTSFYELTAPSGLAIDNNGALYIADQGLNAVFRIDTAGGVTQLDTAAITLNQPRGLAVDASGNLYIANHGANNIVQVTPLGVASVFNDKVVAPDGVAVDAAGSLYVAQENPASSVLQISGSAVTPIADFERGASGVSLDTAGNLYAATGSSLTKLDRADGPSLVFKTPTTVGTSDDVDGPQSFSIQNIGNKGLFSLTNPNVSNPISSSSFTLDQDSTCLSLLAEGANLDPGTGCSVALDFTPGTVGAIQATATLTDNSLALKPATQVIQISGTGVAAVVAPTATQINISGLPATIVAGQNLGKVSVKVEDQSGTVVADWSGSITATINGPNGFAQTITAPAVNGVAALDLTGIALSDPGTYTIAITSGSLTAAHATVIVTPAAASDFTFSLNASAGSGSASQVVAAGQDAVYSLMLAPGSGGFTAPITFSASGLPAGATFTFSPATVTLTDKGTPVTLTIHTAASTAALGGYGVGLGAMLCLLLPFAGSRRLRRAAQQMSLGSLGITALALGVMGIAGCGSTATPPVPPASTVKQYTVTLTATSGSLSHSTTVKLTVE